MYETILALNIRKSVSVPNHDIAYFDSNWSYVYLSLKMILSSALSEVTGWSTLFLSMVTSPE